MQVQDPAIDVHRYLREFAGALGWRHLKRYEHQIPVLESTVHTFTSIVWYESGSMERVFLQINESPSYRAAVYAMRYRLYTGWLRLDLGNTVEAAGVQADRLHGFLAREWFTSLDKRRAFRRMHPECTGWTWKRIRSEAAPYRPC
jgi:hypothetical protein